MWGVIDNWPSPSCMESSAARHPPPLPLPTPPRLRHSMSPDGCSHGPAATVRFTKYPGQNIFGNMWPSQTFTSILRTHPTRQCENAELLVELGYQLSLSGAFDSAVEAYQAGARANEGDVRAMAGVVYCQVRGAYFPWALSELCHSPKRLDDERRSGLSQAVETMISGWALAERCKLGPGHME